MSREGKCRTSDLALVTPPVALALDVFARSLAEIGRADDQDLEALRPGLVASPRTGRDAHRVPFRELDDLVVDLHSAAPAQDHVHLLLLPVRVAVRKAIAGRDALVAQAGLLELERLGRQTELEVRRAVEIGPDVLQVLFQVPERERHGRNRMAPRLGSPAWCVKSHPTPGRENDPALAIQGRHLRRVVIVPQEEDWPARARPLSVELYEDGLI